MAAPSPKEGEGPCPLRTNTNGHTVWFRRSAGGLLKFKCEACDSGSFADQNGAAERDWLASITKRPAGTDPAPAPASGPAPAPRPGFSLGNL